MVYKTTLPTAMPASGQCPKKSVTRTSGPTVPRRTVVQYSRTVYSNTVMVARLAPPMQFHLQSHFACPVMPDRVSYSWQRSSTWPIESSLQRRKVSLSGTFLIIICAFFLPFLFQAIGIHVLYSLCKNCFWIEQRSQHRRNVHRLLTVDLFWLLFLLGQTSFSSSTVVDTRCTLLDQQSSHLSSQRCPSSKWSTDLGIAKKTICMPALSGMGIKPHNAHAKKPTPHLENVASG